MRRVLVSGVALRGDGYPNAENTVALLKGSGQWDVQDQAQWLSPETRLWHLAQGPFIRRLKLVFRLAVGGLLQAARLVANTRAGDLAYLPYPAPVTVWWLSFLPARWRPQCFVDAYISLWDSMFRDRGAGDTNGMMSRLIRRFEGRALRTAAMVLVDTEANCVQMAQDFNLSPNRVRSMPLAIRQDLFTPQPKAAHAHLQPLRVLFVGTLVPLHGIDVVLAAAAQLMGNTGIEIRLIGDGQQGALVEAFVSDRAPGNFTWVRGWQSLDEIAHEISAADVCLGVFGGAGKAARVLPFKLYYALAAGKTIVTQAKYSTPDGAPPLPAVLVINETPSECARQLASVICVLAGDRERLSSLGATGAQYFRNYLSGNAVLAAWSGWRHESHC